MPAVSSRSISTKSPKRTKSKDYDAASKLRDSAASPTKHSRSEGHRKHVVDKPPSPPPEPELRELLNTRTHAYMDDLDEEYDYETKSPTTILYNKETTSFQEDSLGKHDDEEIEEEEVSAPEERSFHDHPTPLASPVTEVPGGLDIAPKELPLPAHGLSFNWKDFSMRGVGVTVFYAILSYFVLRILYML